MLNNSKTKSSHVGLITNLIHENSTGELLTSTTEKMPQQRFKHNTWHQKLIAKLKSRVYLVIQYILNTQIFRHARPIVARSKRHQLKGNVTWILKALYNVTQVQTARGDMRRNIKRQKHVTKHKILLFFLLLWRRNSYDQNKTKLTYNMSDQPLKKEGENHSTMGKMKNSIEQAKSNDPPQTLYYVSEKSNPR